MVEQKNRLRLKTKGTDGKRTHSPHHGKDQERVSYRYSRPCTASLIPVRVTFPMQNTHSPAHFEVLLVDDNRDELESAEATLAEADLPINLRIAKAGETLALLRQEGDFHSAPRPHLILLDFHLQINPLKLLSEIKHDS